VAKRLPCWCSTGNNAAIEGSGPPVLAMFRRLGCGTRRSETAVITEVTDLSLGWTSSVTAWVHDARMERSKIRLLPDENGRGADLFIAWPSSSEIPDNIPEVLRSLGIRPKVQSRVLGSKRWLIQLRLARTDGAPFGVVDLREILRELGAECASAHRVSSVTARAA
jgi:hypothetical protein